MKKLLLVAVMVLTSAMTFAQQKEGSLTIQPKVGLNIASLTDFDDSDPRFGVVAGAELMYQSTDMVGLSFGA